MSIRKMTGMRTLPGFTNPSAMTGSLLSKWVLIAPAILLRISGTSLSYAAFALLVVHAARGYSQAIQALFLSWLFISLNNEIFPPVASVELIRVLILGVAALRVILDIFNRRTPAIVSGVTLPLMFFIGLCLVNAIFVSELSVLSFLKAFFFGLMSLCVLGTWSRLGPLREGLEVWFLKALTAIALLSILLLPLGRGYEVNGYGFQGVLNQPQGFGIMMGLLTTWQLGSMLTKQQFSASQLLRLGLFAALLYMSASRTGMLACLLGTLGAGLIALFSRRPELRRVLASMRRVTLLAIGGTLIILSIIYSQTILQGLETAVFKGNEDTGFSESFEGSRGGLVDQSMENFREQPFFGSGFALPSYLDSLEIVYDPVFGLPVSAPIEKGILPVAVLEELGIVGAVCFLWLIFSLVREVARKGQYHMIGLLVSALAINLGEAVLFSPSGFGLLVWLAIGMAVAPSVQVNTQSNARRTP